MTRFATQLVLASASPRRLQLLQSVGLSCEVVVSEVEELKRPDFAT